MDESKKDFATKLVITWGLVFLFMVALVLEMYIIFQNAPGTALNFSILIIEVFFGVGITVTVTLLASKENKSLKKLVTEQKEMLETMKPIIEKQEKIIEKQEEREIIRQNNILNTIYFWLNTSKHSIFRLDKKKENIQTIFSNDIAREITSLDTCTKEINEKINELFSIGMPILNEITLASASIRIYTEKLKNLENYDEGTVNPIPDSTLVLEGIDAALKKLPKPGPA